MGEQQKIYNEKRVIYLLKHKDALQQSYNERELRLIQELETHSETIEGVAYRSRELKEFVISKTNAPKDPLFDMLESVEHERRNMIIEQIKGLKEIAVKRQELQILLSEYENLEEPFKGVLRMLYIEGMSWDEVISISKKSKTTCSRNRKIGLEMLENRAEERISQEKMELIFR